MSLSLRDKLSSCYEVDANGCWIMVKYLGYSSGTQRQTDGIGYPRIPHQGKKLSAHVSAYETWIGPVPPDHEVDHTCHNKLCINPEHLEAVLHPENLIRRRPFKKRTPCSSS